MKKLASMLLTLAMVMAMLPTAFAAEVQPFTDVAADYWAADAIEWAYEKGYIKGKTETAYAPFDSVSRQQVWMVQARMDGGDPANMAEAKAWAMAEGITDGTNPGKAVSRQQLVTMLWRSLGEPAADVSLLNTWPDVSDVANYAKGAMAWAVSTGIIGGTTDGRLDPMGNATRAQFVVILKRTCDKGEAPVVPADEYSVTFELNYGTAGTHRVYTAEAGKKVDRPGNPVRSGYSFDGWYTEPTGGERFDFGTAITADITLYAQWTKRAAHIHSYTYVTNNDGTHSKTCCETVIEECSYESGNICVSCGYDNSAVAMIGETYYATLAEAFAVGGEVVVLKDVALTETVTVEAGKTVALDLNGKTVSMEDASGAAAAMITNKGTLTVMDGVGTGKLTFGTTTPSMSNAYASNTISNFGTVTIESGVLENTSVGGACYVLDNYAGSTATISGGELTAEKTAVRIFDWTNGAGSELNVTGGVILSKDGYGINLNMGNAPTVVLNITGGTVTTEDTDYNLAVYVVSKGSAENVTIDVTGGTLDGNFALNGLTSTTMADGAISVSGGTIEGVVCYDTPAYAFITGGTFSADPSEYVAYGYEAVADGESFTVVASVPVASVGGEVYYSLRDAVAAAGAGDTVILTADDNAAAGSGGYNMAGVNHTNGATIDGNGNTLTVSGANATWDCAIYTSGGTIKNLTIGGAFRGIFTAGCSQDIVIDNVIIDNVCYTFSSDGANADCSVIFTNSTLNGWTSYANGYESVSFTDCKFGAGTGIYTEAYLRPYSDTWLENCEFSEGYELDATRATSYLYNCTVGGVEITKDNLVELLGADAADAVVVTYVDGIWYYGTELYEVTDEFEGTTVNVAEGTTAIGSYAFASNSNIETIVLPSSVTTLSDRAFRDTSASTVVLNEGLTNISYQAFRNASNVKSVVIPSTVTTISKEAFQNSGIETLTIPATVTTIEYGGCRDMKALETVIIEGNVEIPVYAFRACTNLKTVYLNGDDVTFAGRGMIFTNKENGDGSAITVYVKNETVKERLLAADTAAKDYGGYKIAISVSDGFAIDPETGAYEISNAAGLTYFADQVNKEGNRFSGKTVKLIADIDLANAAWTPIGQTGATEFRGVFDGQDYTIKNLNVDSSDKTDEHTSSGLFGWAEAGVTIKNVKIDGATVKGNHNVAVIVGYTYSGKITNCSVSNAQIVCTHANDDACGDKCGIIVGYAGNESRISGCSATDCTVTAGRDAGQLIGAGYNVSVSECSAANVTVAAGGDCPDQKNINEAIIGRVLG